MSKVSVIVPVYNVENYIRDMLTSVQNQEFRDFEVIIINDGSPDNSQAIIDEFCATDKRFKRFIQDNAGVSAARNRGLQEATGEYVVFYDPDDFIPKDALGKMYKTAASKNADMVIGIMEERSLGESLIYMNSQKLARKKHIEPTDENFIGAWSLCNKMFSLEFLRSNDLRFEKLHNAEDGVFTFCALNHANRICGCKVVAYNYVRRPFWMNASATQIINKEYFNGLMKSHDRIIEEASKLSEKISNPEDRKKYMQNLYVRFIDKEMLNAYYRLIWKAEEDLIPILNERTTMYRQQITEEQWKHIIEKNRDLQLDRNFLPVDILAREPIVSIAVTDNLPAIKINTILGSIYNQQFQRFEVLLPEKYEHAVNEFFSDMPNLHFINEGKTEAINIAKGRYITFIDEYVIYTNTSLITMVNCLEKGNIDFVSVLMKHYDGKNFINIPCLNGSYGYTKKAKTEYNELDKCDVLFANKLFKKSSIEGFEFSKDKIRDITLLFVSFRFEKIRKGVMITDLTQNDLVMRSGSIIPDKVIRRASAQNLKINNFIEYMKRHINKEDIKKLKDIFIRIKAFF